MGNHVEIKAVFKARNEKESVFYKYFLSQYYFRLGFPLVDEDITIKNSKNILTIEIILNDLRKHLDVVEHVLSPLQWIQNALEVKQIKGHVFVYVFRSLFTFTHENGR